LPKRGSTTFVSDEPDCRREQYDDRQNEPPVAKRVHRPRGIDDACGFLSEAEQQNVDLPGGDIACVTAGNCPERCCKAGDRVSSGRGIDDCRQRDKDDVGSVGRMMRDHSDKRHDRRQDGLWRIVEGGPDQRRK
jgi:hypothetical protein